MANNPVIQNARPDILALESYRSARSLFNGNAATIYLDANELPIEPYIGAKGLSRYPKQQPTELVNALCQLYDVSSKNLIVTRGADEAIDIIVRAFCVAGEDSIIITPPSFAMYAHAAILQGAKVQAVPLQGKNFSLNVNGVIKAITSKTKIVFLCSPNNPTGTIIPQDDIVKICQAAPETVIVVDETYIEFANTSSCISLLEKYQNLLILRTLSKAYGATGIRCGVAIAHSEIISLLLNVLAPYPIPVPVVQEALKILKPESLKRLSAARKDILLRRDQFMEQLRAMPEVVNIISSHANFLLVQFKNAKKTIEQTRAANIVLRDQSHVPGLENHIRITIGSDDEMQQLLDVLQGKARFDSNNDRVATINRNTNETAIAVTVNLDKQLPIKIATGVGFYDHMLEALAKHAGFSLQLECQGDLHVDQHHTIEDCAIALGQALDKALGDRRGIGRYGFTVPMDEALAEAAIDLSGRAYLDFKGSFPDQAIGEMPTDLVPHVFRSLAENLRANIHIKVSGENSHHMVEACFKAVARALRQAIRREEDDLPSTKGIL